LAQSTTKCGNVLLVGFASLVLFLLGIAKNNKILQFVFASQQNFKTTDKQLHEARKKAFEIIDSKFK